MAVLLAFPLAGQAQFTFVTVKGSVTLTQYTGNSSSVVIPQSVNGLPVTVIGQGAFANHNEITNVIFPASLTAIAPYAFSNCRFLKTLCFQGNQPALTQNPFSVKLATVYYLPGAKGWGTVFCNMRTVLWNLPVPFSYSTNDDNSITITGYTGSDHVATIPSSIWFMPVTGIAPGAFFNEVNLTNLSLPNSISSIGDWAFESCEGLTSLTVPSSVTNFGKGLFYGCVGLTDVTLQNQPTNITEGLFYACSNLTDVVIPNSVTEIGPAAFYGCTALTNLLLPGSVTTLVKFAQSTGTKKAEKGEDQAAEPEGDTTTKSKTPEELIGAAYQTIHATLKQELLDLAKKMDPLQFEQLVLDLLVAMGYGGSKAEAAKVTKASNDEGIDGLINEDRLGLDVIYVQAKRWKDTVGRKEIQSFVGALAGQQAHKGIFITTSDFADTAIAYAKKVTQKVILIDGDRLADLMIQHDIGVSTSHAYVVKHIDSDYFEED